jgi:mono/diheme cytochrome c family protein/lysophospholipase L1-like esterase/glucose/arabinose dehydrogenase
MPIQHFLSQTLTTVSLFAIMECTLAPAAESNHVVRNEVSSDKHSLTLAEAEVLIASKQSIRPSDDDITADGAGGADSQPFEFKQDDRVVFIGNGLADRFQHDGWVETALQSQLQGKNVSFRNMAVSGDQVDKQPRDKGFTPEGDYLKLVKPDVIFAFFGYNESYDGIGKADAYKDRLVKMVKRLQDLKPNGKSAPRVVLFSPIAFENKHDPNLPDGTKQNGQLAAYTAATKAAAIAAGVTFVDIYAPTIQAMVSSPNQLTLNGCHLSQEGDRHLGEIIAKQLLGKTITLSEKTHGMLRAAIMGKDWHWQNRYRMTDGNDVWGSRSVLSFVNNQSNADVLKHELTMLDVLSNNRDKVIWAASAGKSIKPDDSNVPAPVAVTSNVGGKSKSSNASKEGSVNYLTPAESASKAKVPDGFEVSVFSSEEKFPGLINPVQMQVDSKGRLWAACWPTYPMWEPLKEMNDSLVIMPDENRDGVPDKHIVFAKVHNPLGFEFWNGGVLVTSGPNLLFLKDTDGDDVADVREVMLQGLGTSDTHHAANNLIYGPDGGIYWQSGVFLVHNYEHPWGSSLNTSEAGMYRFDPRRWTISFHAGNSPNPHGTSFDYWGYCYANDGTGGRSFQVRPEGKGFKMHPLLTKEVRPVPADAIVSSTNFPDNMQQNFLVCNAIGFLGIKNYVLHRDGYQEGKNKFAPGEVWGTPSTEMLISADGNFRPTDAVFGDDGALYVSDWANVIIGHMQHNIRDPNRDKTHGRILRITYKSRPLQPSVKIDGQPIPALLENLKNPIDGIRHRTHVELSERNSKEVIAATRTWMKDFDANKPNEAHHLLEALWVNQQHNVRDEALLKKLLGSSVVHAKIAAQTVNHFWKNVDSTSGQIINLEEAEKAEVAKVPAHLTGADAKAYQLGAEVFRREAHCATCHQPQGTGLANIYPPLVNSPWVLGSETRLIKISLHGLWGKITVNGATYDPLLGVPPMTAFKSILNDEEIAGVLTYVRNSWGNKASAVSPEAVKKVRQDTAKQTTFLVPDELLKEHPLE